MREAKFYEKLHGKKIKCTACARYCTISPEKTGFCRVRKNVNGKLYSLVYNKALTQTADPIEKKPIYNFMPATYCSSISTYGCNFKCLFCQNFSLSQEFLEEDIQEVGETTPEEIVENTIARDLDGISYTYVEPTVFIEYALDIMKIAKKQGLYNVWVSNGYMSKESLKELCKYVDAANIDLKGDADFYKKLCGNAELGVVKSNIEALFKAKVHVEVTNLIIPGINDSKPWLHDVCSFVSALSKDMPLHFSRFFPHYKMSNIRPTPLETLAQAYDIAKSLGLNYVYIGNIGSEQNTFCPKCKEIAIRRAGYNVNIVGLSEKGLCTNCGHNLGIKMPKKAKKCQRI
ncbi:MAG: AmmeMemoRadiSam system radical SAM enzyme [Candidatus Diapherotrites archaeon]|nr:AmmeMemoRadiSam system radical SAM enzyme [Candidatus Diapherotrites archaeon]